MSNNHYKILVPTNVKELIVEDKQALEIWYRQKNYTSTFATIIDVDDWLKVAGYYWCRSTVDGYAVRHDGEKRIFMHHEIIGRPPKGLEVDHINRNRLDNRRANLRIIPRPKNALNSARSDNAKHADALPSGRWRARVRQNGKDLHLGVFNSKTEATNLTHKFKEMRELFLTEDELARWWNNFRESPFRNFWPSCRG